MSYEERLKKSKTLRRAGLACLLAGFGMGGFSMYKLYENSELLNEGPKLAQQVFDCVDAGAKYDEATKIATMPQECYAKLQEYKAFNDKPETKEALENITFYNNDIVRYGPLGLFLVGAIINGKGKTIARKAKEEKEREEADDEED